MMTCPRCGSPVEPAQAECGGCSFSLAAVIGTFGHKLVQLDRLTDAANCLRLRDAQAIDEYLEDLETDFPQVFFAAYFGVLPPSFSPGELSFWLLNHAAFNNEELKKLNEFAVLLIVDPVGKCAGINVGYALESVLTTKKLQKVLQGIRTPLWHGELVNAVTSALGKVAKLLRQSGQPTRASTSLEAPGSTQEFMGRSGLRSLRPADSPPPVREADFEWRNRERDRDRERDSDDLPYI
jgi:hypothetical protein